MDIFPTRHRAEIALLSLSIVLAVLFMAFPNIFTRASKGSEELNFTEYAFRTGNVEKMIDYSQLRNLQTKKGRYLDTFVLGQNRTDKATIVFSNMWGMFEEISESKRKKLEICQKQKKKECKVLGRKQLKAIKNNNFATINFKLSPNEAVTVRTKIGKKPLVIVGIDKEDGSSTVIFRKSFNVSTALLAVSDNLQPVSDGQSTKTGFIPDSQLTTFYVNSGMVGGLRSGSVSLQTESMPTVAPDPCKRKLVVIMFPGGEKGPRREVMFNYYKGWFEGLQARYPQSLLPRTEIVSYDSGKGIAESANHAIKEYIDPALKDPNNYVAIFAHCQGAIIANYAMRQLYENATLGQQEKVKKQHIKSYLFEIPFIGGWGSELEHQIINIIGLGLPRLLNQSAADMWHTSPIMEDLRKRIFAPKTDARQHRVRFVEDKAEYVFHQVLGNEINFYDHTPWINDIEQKPVTDPAQDAKNKAQVKLLEDQFVWYITNWYEDGLNKCPTVTPTPTVTITPIPSLTNTPEPTETPVPVPTSTSTATVTASPTATTTATPTQSKTPTPTNTPTSSPTPTEIPSPIPTEIPSPIPSEIPTYVSSDSSSSVSSSQVAEICGDGVVQPELGEQCDLGNNNGNGYGCDLNCKNDSYSLSSDNPSSL